MSKCLHSEAFVFVVVVVVVVAVVAVVAVVVVVVGGFAVVGRSPHICFSRKTRSDITILEFSPPPRGIVGVAIAAAASPSFPTSKTCD